MQAERAGKRGAQPLDRERRQQRQQHEVDELVDEQVFDVEHDRGERLAALGRAAAFDEREARVDEQHHPHVDGEGAQELEHGRGRQSGATARAVRRGCR
jgi:hypothetical protein